MLLVFSVWSCTNPYALQTQNFEDVLVIEATITNEFKPQEIKITQTYRLEQTVAPIVSNAAVKVEVSDGSVYIFQFSNGRYVSTIPFQASVGKQYQLIVKTPGGKTYSSTSENLSTINNLQNLQAIPTVKDGAAGVGIFAKSFDASNTSKYYRFEYEETHQVIAPRWINGEAIVTLADMLPPYPAALNIFARTTEARVCYSNQKSDKIILTSTNDLAEDRIDFPVRFIKSNDYFIANRYTILVRQYVQNLAAYTYYKTLRDLSSSNGILSQSQPGFFFGNLKSESDPLEKVIGFFDVASVSSKRLFFNYRDIFPGQFEPAYPFKCPDIDDNNRNEYVQKFCFTASLNGPSCFGLNILNDIYYKRRVYFENDGDKYTLYPIQCGDCTSFSSNIKPSFWID